MNLTQIASIARGYVQNDYTDSEYAEWLTAINQHFFEVVKIPRVVMFNALKDIASYALAAGIAVRNIDRVMVGTQKYESLQLTDVPPGQNGWTFDEATNKLTLSPAPKYDAQGYIRYAQKASKIFNSTNMLDTPEAPEEYHHLYAFGLAELIALTLDDTIKASNYGQQYVAQLAVAQANYQRG